MFLDIFAGPKAQKADNPVYHEKFILREKTFTNLGIKFENKHLESIAATEYWVEGGPENIEMAKSCVSLCWPTLYSGIVWFSFVHCWLWLKWNTIRTIVQTDPFQLFIECQCVIVTDDIENKIPKHYLWAPPFPPQYQTPSCFYPWFSIFYYCPCLNLL